MLEQLKFWVVFFFFKKLNIQIVYFLSCEFCCRKAELYGRLLG